MRQCGYLMALLSVCLIVGCSKGEKRYPVKGKVTLQDGTAVPNAVVTFANSEKNISASGRSAPDGTFELSTDEPGDGAPAGSYKVSVAPQTDPATSKVLVQVDKKFQNPSTTPLQLTVKDEDNSFDIKVDPGKAKG